MPKRTEVSIPLIVLVTWLVALPLLFAMVVAIYPPYLRRRAIRRRDTAGAVVIRMPARTTRARHRKRAAGHTLRTPGA